MFAVTGRYPQLCFNLGNRVTIYGSLLLAYAIIVMPMNRMVRIAVAGLLIFVILGISDHWKNWSLHQQEVITNIRNNEALKTYRDARTIFVAGNQYSRYGPISHIEFLSETWVPNGIFGLLFDTPPLASTINKRFRYADGYLIDTKYGVKTKVDGYINVYDSEKDEFFRVPAGLINGYIDRLPFDRRHWVQLLDSKYVNAVLIKLMPRLRYAM